MPKVSVIISNYNHEKFLQQRIDSILCQTFRDFEVIILDDCSTDNSRAVIERYRNHDKVSRIIYNSENSGNPFQQWAKGIKAANADWVWLAESDNYAAPEFLASLIALTEKRRGAGVVFCDTQIIDGNEWGISAGYSDDDQPYNDGIKEVMDRMSRSCTTIDASCCIIKKHVALLVIEGLLPNGTCSKPLFYIRLLQHAHFAYTSKKLNFYQCNCKSISYAAFHTESWLADGVSVLKSTDFKIIGFSLKQFLSVSNMWLANRGSSDYQINCQVIARVGSSQNSGYNNLILS